MPCELVPMKYSCRLARYPPATIRASTTTTLSTMATGLVRSRRRRSGGLVTVSGRGWVRGGGVVATAAPTGTLAPSPGGAAVGGGGVLAAGGTIIVASSGGTSCATSSRRQATTVMLSRPPASLASAISWLPALSSVAAVRRISAILSSETMAVRPSLQSSRTSPARTG